MRGAAGARRRRSRRSTVAGCRAVPGLVDCHTHVCFGGDRVNEFSLRAGGATLRGAARRRRRHPLDGARDTSRGRGGARRDHGAPPGVDARPRDDDVRGQVGLRPRSRHGARAAPGRPRGRRRADLARRAHGAARVRRRRCLRRLPARGGPPDAAALAEAADVFLERGSFDAAQARRYLEACRAAGLALRLHGDQFTESGAIPLAIELGARSVDHLEATGRTGSRSSRRATSPASCCPRARSSSAGRCLRRARSSTRARSSPSRRTSTRERVLREPAARPLARVHADEARARGGARRGDRQRRPRPRPRTTGSAGSRPGFAADIVLLDAPDWRHVAYHLGGRHRPHRDRERSGRVPAHGIIHAMATQKQRRRRAKEKRHDYDLVYIDEDGVEKPVEREEAPRKPPARVGKGGTTSRRARRRQPASAERRRPRAAAALVAARYSSAVPSSHRSSSRP